MNKKIMAVWVLGMMSVVACWGQGYDPRSRVMVSGESVVYAVPNKVTITMGAETYAAQANAAKDANNAIIRKALTAVKKAGIADEDIQTQRLTVDPRWEYNNQTRKQEFVGYQVRNIFVVTLKDVEKLEGVIVAGMDSGINVMQGVSFETTELNQYREQAREQALLVAKDKATKMAAVLGQSIGRPLEVSEQEFTPATGARMLVLAESDSASGGEPTVALGKITIRSNVNVTFELLPSACPCGSSAEGKCNCGE